MCFDIQRESCLTEHKLFEELNGIAAKWYRLGLCLSLERNTLDIVERDNPDAGLRMAGMLSHWFNNTPNGSWKDVVDALRKMDESRMALRLQKKYCKEVHTPAAGINLMHKLDSYTLPVL